MKALFAGETASMPCLLICAGALINRNICKFSPN
jgi:hypothetical protein